MPQRTDAAGNSSNVTDTIDRSHTSSNTVLNINSVTADNSRG
ncbi:hypothetical protein [Acinetobacter sp. C26M]|nr:hypothetical protein [Acinetobacter sp. C26M]